MSGGRPPGHNFRIARTRIDEGWRLTGTCICRAKVTATNYPDLEALIADHYADARHQQQQARDERAHT